MDAVPYPTQPGQVGGHEGVGSFESGFFLDGV